MVNESMDKKLEKENGKEESCIGENYKEETILSQSLFPHDSIREYQSDMLTAVNEAISGRKNIIIHAPTGIGKTAATLAPALKKAIDDNLTVFFLTGRHTQHSIAVSTLREVKRRYGIDVVAADIIGRVSMCPIAGAVKNTMDFNEYCRKMREDYKCSYFANTKKRGGGLTVDADNMISKLKARSPEHVEKVMEMCNSESLCAYEISTALGAKSTVIIADYYHIFDEDIRKALFSRINKTLDKSIIIIDEGHNLPKRARELMTSRTTNFTIERAIKEAKKFGYEGVISFLVLAKEIIEVLLGESKEQTETSFRREGLITKNQFSERFIGGLKQHGKTFEEAVADMEFAADDVRERNKLSYIGSVSNFLQAWQGPDEGYARIISYEEKFGEKIIVLSYRCLDPSIATKPVIDEVCSTIVMSATLSPLLMYQSILGFEPERTMLKSYGSPFPKINKLNIVVPETTTMYKKRDIAQFMKIADACANIVNSVPGNSVIFFPSYSLRDQINIFFNNKCKKTIFLEDSRLSKEEKATMLDNFKSYQKKTGAVLLGVASGNFSEGIDLPGVLSCVILAGLPLQPPDLETKELIKYYDGKFSKGFEYGYVYPAINKCLQSAGRCIRSEKDRGVLIFLDERFAWSNYFKCFPADWNMVVTKNYLKLIESFFKTTP